jgi:hypothetical protein
MCTAITGVEVEANMVEVEDEDEAKLQILVDVGDMV